MIDKLDDINCPKNNYQSPLESEGNIKINSYVPKISKFSEQLRIGISFLLGSLQMLSENLDYSSEQKKQLFREISTSAISLLDTLQLIAEELSI